MWWRKLYFCPVSAPVAGGIKVFVVGTAGYPTVLRVDKTNGAVTTATTDFLDRFPGVAPVCGGQQKSFAAPVRDGRLDAHPAVGGVEEKDLGSHKPADTFRQGIEVLDCPAQAAVRSRSQIKAEYVSYVSRLTLERQQHPSSRGVEEEHTGNFVGSGILRRDGFPVSAVVDGPKEMVVWVRQCALISQGPAYPGANQSHSKFSLGRDCCETSQCKANAKISENPN